MRNLFLMLYVYNILISLGCKKDGGNDPGAGETDGILVPAGYSEALSVGRSGMAVAAIDNKAFFGGGLSYYWNGQLIPTFYKTVDIYDAISGQWSSAALSEARAHLAAASANTRVVFAGGITSAESSSNKVDIYDVKTKQWTTDTLSQARAHMGVAAAGSKMLFAGGFHIVSGLARYSDVVDIYDVNTGKWQKAALSAARRSPVAAAAGNKILFAGGEYGGLSMNTVDIYDVSTGQWKTDTLSVRRVYAGAVAIGNKIIIAGGFQGQDNTDQVEIYDVTTGKWTKQTLTNGRRLFACAALGNKLVLAGGATAEGLTNTIEVFDVSTFEKDATTYLVKQPVLNHSAVTVGKHLVIAGGLYENIISGQREYRNIKTVHFFELKN